MGWNLNIAFALTLDPISSSTIFASIRCSHRVLRSCSWVNLQSFLIGYDIPKWILQRINLHFVSSGISSFIYKVPLLTIWPELFENVSFVTEPDFIQLHEKILLNKTIWNVTRMHDFFPFCKRFFGFVFDPRFLNSDWGFFIAYKAFRFVSHFSRDFSKMLLHTENISSALFLR